MCIIKAKHPHFVKRVVKVRKIRKAIGRMARGAWRRLGKLMYRVRARYEDWRLGGISLEGIKPSKYTEKGAKATESTNYEWLDQIFKVFPYPQKTAFVDVGCGEGRVLTYLYLRGCKVPMIGIELDPEVAEVAKRRTRDCPNIHIHCGNILDCGEIIKDAGEFYLFNPFTEDVMARFVEMIEENCNHPVVVFYCNDIYRNLLDKRQNWTIIWRNMLKSRNGLSRSGTIYGYMPEAKEEKSV